jgi:hypothetical protein
VNVDVREVLLATIRDRLLDDFNRVRRGADERRLFVSIAEQALAAALARGATLEDVCRIAYAELEGADVPEMEWMPDDPRPLFADAELDDTLEEARRAGTLEVLGVLTLKLRGRAFSSLLACVRERIRERGLDEWTAIGEVVGPREQVELFTAGI